MIRGCPMALLSFVAVVGCSSGPQFAGGLDVVVSPHISTVVAASWEANDPACESAYVLVDGPQGTDSAWIPASLEGSRFETTVVGLKPDRGYRLHAVEVSGGAAMTSPGVAVQTGSAPTTLPSLSVAAGSDGATGFLVTSTVSFPSLAVILDRDGECVWWHQLTPPEGGDWETFYIPKVARTLDGSAVIYEAATGVENANRERILVKVSMDGADVETLPIQQAHHDFVELADGAIAVLMEDSRPVGEQMIEGDRIVEVDEGGEQTTVWSIWDHAEFEQGDEYDPDTGWSHANAIQYHEGAYYVSLRNFDAVYKIDRGSGDVLWIAGGDESDFALADGETKLFERQHRFRVLEEGILIFDNRVPEEGSRAVEYALDGGDGSAEVLWEYMTDPPLFSLGFGDVERLPGGNTLVDWSAQGQIDEVTPGGEILWQLNASVGSGFGYMEWFESFVPSQESSSASQEQRSQ